MSRRSDDKRFPVSQGRSTDLFDRAGMAKIDRYIAVFDGRLNCIAQIALRDDVDPRIVLGKIDNRLAHSTARPDQRHADLSLLHRQATLTPTLSLQREMEFQEEPSLFRLSPF